MNINRELLVKILKEIAAHVESVDSLEGSIEYSYSGSGEFSVLGTYRTGNLDGQGGIRVIK